MLYSVPVLWVAVPDRRVVQPQQAWRSTNVLLAEVPRRSPLGTSALGPGQLGPRPPGLNSPANIYMIQRGRLLREEAAVAGSSKSTTMASAAPMKG